MAEAAKQRRARQKKIFGRLLAEKDALALALSQAKADLAAKQEALMGALGRSCALSERVDAAEARAERAEAELKTALGDQEGYVLALQQEFAVAMSRAGDAEYRANKADDLKNRYKAAFKRWVGFCKDWRARSDQWQEIAAQGEFQLRELPPLKESYRKVLNLWHAWFPGCCCEVDMPCPEHDKTEVEVEAMSKLGWGHPDALRSLQEQVKTQKARAEKSEALAEEGGRVIENLRGVVVAARSALVVGSPERTDVVLQMIHKALTPEPAKEDGNGPE